MAFGNTGAVSGAVVAISRDAATGEARINGECAANVVCRDVSADCHEPAHFEALVRDRAPLHRDIVEATKRIEARFKRPVTIDFVVSDERPRRVGVMPAKLTAAARFRAAKDVVADEVLSKAEGLVAIEPADLAQLLAVRLAGEPGAPFLAGVCAGKGCVVGRVCLSPADVAEARRDGVTAVLVRNAPAPTDFAAFLGATAVVTACGGNVRFAAAASHLFRKKAALGCAGLRIDDAGRRIGNGADMIAAGELMTVTGCALELEKPELLEDVNAIEILT